MSEIHLVTFKSPIENLQFPGVMDVLPKEVFAYRDQLSLIDVRTPSEYMGELGHIPKSVLVPLQSLPLEVSKIPKDQTVVFICRSGNRSAQACGWAIEQGFKNVFNLHGGMIRWNDEGLEVES